MKKLLLTGTILLATTASAFAQDVSNIVAVVTTPDPQIQLMSMVLTAQTAQRGIDVHVLLCGSAGDMALRDAPESVTAAQPPLNVSPQSFTDILRQNENTTVEVCALYLPGKGISPSDLLDSIGVASPGMMSELLTASDARVISF